MPQLIVKIWPTPNWGDMINEELVKLLVGSQPYDIKFVPRSQYLHTDNYLVVGSSLRFADRNSIVWGTGFFKGDEQCQGGAPKKVHAVRGPKSRAHLLELGIECPEVFGDPVLLFPRYYQPKIEKKYKLGIVLHWQDDWHQVVRSMQLSPEILIIRHNAGKYQYIDQICSCEKIASSSLHGIIVADAYGVPNLQLTFFKQDMFKYQDYFESVDRKVNPIDCEAEVNLDKIMSSFVRYKISIDLDKLYNACPFKEECK